VRYYFPRKTDLLDAFFWYSAERLEKQVREELRTADKDPRSHLIAIASLHYDRILEVEDASYFEILALWARTPRYRKTRNSWYQRLSGYYTDLLRDIHPEWDEERCTATAFQLMTLVLGGWISLGSSRPLHPRRGRKALKAMLLEGVERLIA
jgi:AcrR family transcriptional regulator